MTLKQEAEQIARAAAEQGFEVRRTTRGHYLFFRAELFVCDLGGTPGSQKEITRKLAKLRKAGLVYGRRG